MPRTFSLLWSWLANAKQGYIGLLCTDQDSSILEGLIGNANQSPTVLFCLEAGEGCFIEGWIRWRLPGTYRTAQCANHRNIILLDNPLACRSIAQVLAGPSDQETKTQTNPCLLSPFLQLCWGIWHLLSSTLSGVWPVAYLCLCAAVMYLFAWVNRGCGISEGS